MDLIQKSKSAGTRDLQMTQHFQKDSALQPTPPSANLFHSWQTDLHPGSIYNKSEHEPTPHKSTTKFKVVRNATDQNRYRIQQILIQNQNHLNPQWLKPLRISRVNHPRCSKSIPKNIQIHEILVHLRLGLESTFSWPWISNKNPCCYLGVSGVSEWIKSDVQTWCPWFYQSLSLVGSHCWCINSAEPTHQL